MLALTTLASDALLETLGRIGSPRRCFQTWPLQKDKLRACTSVVPTREIGCNCRGRNWRRHSPARPIQHYIRVCQGIAESLFARDLFVRETYTLGARAPLRGLQELQLGVMHDPLTKEIPRDTDNVPEREAVAKVETVEHGCVIPYWTSA